MSCGDVPDVYWKKLLAITTKATAESETISGGGNDIPKTMSDENRKWLETVMADMVKQSDPSRILDHILESLHCYASDISKINDNDVAKIVELAEHLEEVLGYAEITSSFVKKGGLLIIETFLEQRLHETLQCQFAELVLSITENNPPTQSLLSHSGFLKKLIELLQDETYNEKFRYKILGSISGSVRSHVDSFDIFLSLHGPSTISKIVTSYSRNPKLSEKAARVLTSIAYTMQDSAPHSKLLIPDICTNFVFLLRNENGTWSDELSYIGDFILQYVSYNDITNDIRIQLTEALDQAIRHYSTCDPVLDQLRSKFTA